MFHHDGSRTGYTSNNGPTITPLKVWSYQIKQSDDYDISIGASPAVANGYLYINNDVGSFYCLNASTGTPIWSGKGCPSYSSPAIDNGYVYTSLIGVTNTSAIIAYNASTGDQMWARDGGIGTSFAVANGVVYTSADEQVFAFNTSTGSPLWTTIPLEGGISSPAVTNGYVYVGGDYGKIYAYDASTGRQVWNSTTGIGQFYSPSVADGRVYIGSFLRDDNSVYCLDALTGAIIWNYTFPPTEYYADSSPAIVDGVVYAAGGDAIYAFGMSEASPLPPSQEPFPTTWVAVAAFVAVMISVSLFFAYKIRRKGAKSSPRTMSTP
jgi:outer membrane protein assembly factor BamB